MDERRMIRISKYLAKHLRHQPERLGLVLDTGGWVDVDVLLAACAANGFALTRAELEHVVTANDKQRYAFDPAGTRIRANQGHTVAVDLDLPVATPPDVLYHGTAHRFRDAIAREGLRPMDRHDVHLSADPETARRVGARHGTPVVLRVDAAAMGAAGHTFRVSANGVWLVGAVPPEFLG
ncbi:RNA 2'-phosphotransferase [Actinophytocola xinjiangensis]|uniref:Probable RNA 2'-phosphotransferase n=1 Tax=Actinophytocola xinjiangensis TaxID=485602 RepID=A0A7Z1B1G5_9PSEU|nr:RNA 2'-phosphotransferase [Actinophytocola xinjiangensis]OLF13882.1 RNA 2'-phosphotransferase [Actinophytocola xinjiangensis]